MRQYGMDTNSIATHLQFQTPKDATFVPLLKGEAIERGCGCRPILNRRLSACSRKSMLVTFHFELLRVLVITHLQNLIVGGVNKRGVEGELS